MVMKAPLCDINTLTGRSAGDFPLGRQEKPLHCWSPSGHLRSCRRGRGQGPPQLQDVI